VTVSFPGAAPAVAVDWTAADATDLAPLWREIEAQSCASFFLSWTWIGTWLATAEARPMLVVARQGGRVIGLGLLSEAVQRRRLMRIPSLHLHETGDRRRDGIAIEYNGFLSLRGYEATASLALLEAVLADRRRWRELYLSGIDGCLRDLAVAGGFPVHLRNEANCPLVDLEAVRGRGSDYLAALSANTRYQIRRAMRLYEEAGPLALDRAATVDEALAFLGELKVLHQRYWRAKGRPGAFAEPFFERFHRRLITTGHPRGEVALLRVRAGAEVLGYLYNFVHSGHVYSYQNGFAYKEDGRYKPGLVAHALAVGQALGEGLSSYRFLAGESRYKASLSTGSHPMYWLTLQRPSMALRLEALARKLRQRARG